MSIAVEEDINGLGEIACMWWTRHDQDGPYLDLKFAAVTSQQCHLTGQLGPFILIFHRQYSAALAV